MVDPADTTTPPLPHPTKLVFISDARVYTVVLDVDLLGDWAVVQSWGARGDRRGGSRVTHVPSFEAGLALVRAIACRRKRHGYKLIG